VIFRRILFATAAIAASAAATAVVVVALAFALFALAEPRLGRAGAAGVVALTAAVCLALGGLVLALMGRRRAMSAPEGMLEQIFDLLQQKPVVAALGAIAAGLMTIRNPKYLGGALRGFFERKSGK
jgi:hypothetical protein